MARGVTIVCRMPRIAATLKLFAGLWAALRRLGQAVHTSRRLLAWLLACWAVAVAVPAALLYPDHGLDRPALQVLLALAPLGALAGAATAQPWVALAAGLAGLLPPLVACPALHQQPPARPLSSLLLALLLVIACDAAARQFRGDTGRLRLLLRWPEWPRGRWLAALGALWLVIAWLPTQAGWQLPEGQRALRVVGAAAAWSLLAAGGEKPWQNKLLLPWRPLLLRRAAWLLLIGALLWAWRSPA